MAKYFKVEISAETKAQANDILDALLAKKLVAGSVVTNNPARFWWKGKIEEMDYYNLSAFTVDRFKLDITRLVESISVEETPLIWFIEIEGSKKLQEWVKDSLK